MQLESTPMPTFTVKLKKIGSAIEVESIKFDSIDECLAIDFEGSEEAFRALVYVALKSSRGLSAKEKEVGIASPVLLMGPLRNAIRNKAKWLWLVFNNDPDDFEGRKSERGKQNRGDSGYSVSRYLSAHGSDSNPRVKFEPCVNFKIFITKNSSGTQIGDGWITLPATRAEKLDFQYQEDATYRERAFRRNINHRIEVARCGREDSIFLTRGIEFKGLSMDDHLAFKSHSNFSTSFSIVWIDWNRHRRIEPLFPYKWKDKDDVSQIAERELTPTQARYQKGGSSTDLELPANGFYRVNEDGGLHCFFCIASNAVPSENEFRKLLMCLDQALAKSPKPMQTFPLNLEFASSPLPLTKKITLGLDHPDERIWSQEVLKNYGGWGEWIDLIVIPNIGE